MAEHVVHVCKHGTKIGECRCPAPNKTAILDECPSSHSSWTEEDHPALYSDGTGRFGKPVLLLTKPDAVVGGVVSTDRVKLVALIKRISPIKHEPLATLAAEEWADEFQREGWHL